MFPLPAYNRSPAFWGPPVSPVTHHNHRVQPEAGRPTWTGAQTLFAALWFLLLQIPLGVVVSLVAASAAPEPGVNMQERTLDAVMSPAVLLLNMVAQWFIFFGYPCLVSWWRGQKSIARDFGFRMTRRDAIFGVVTGVALQGVMLGVGLLWPVKGSGNTNMLVEANGATLVILVFSAAVAAPIVEEVFFRGLVLRGFLRTFARVDLAPVHEGVTDDYRARPAGALRRRVGTVAAIVASSVIFGFMHLQADSAGHVGFGQWLVVIQTGLLGAVFAVIAYKMKRLGFVVAAHLGFNLTAVVLTLTLVR